MRIKVTFSYDGSKFNGFQRQKVSRSVQKTLEDALKSIYGEEVFIKGSGRTDAGVHANGQVCHFDAPTKIDNLKSKLNNLLLPDIVIKKVQIVNDDFHARCNVKKKEYIYKIYLGKYKSALKDYYYEPSFKLDISLMKEAAKYMIGTHDFHNFVSGERDNYVTTIYDISFNKMFDKLEIHFIGTGFYRYMIRNLMGALIDVGRCKERSSVIEKMLNNPDDNLQLMTAPPEGLYLNKIWY